MSKINLFGVALLCIGIVCIGVSAAQKSEDDIKEGIYTGGRSPLLDGLFAILVGFGGLVIICTS